MTSILHEQWRPVLTFEDRFLISNQGRIFSLLSNKILSQGLSKTGYATLSTKIGGRSGKYYCFKIHRLVANAFLPNPDNKPFVNHINGVKTNNHVDNLEWVTNQENIQHAYDTGLIIPKSGVDAYQSKLSLDQISLIRQRYIPYCKYNGARALSKEFGVYHSTISDIVNLKTYK